MLPGLRYTPRLADILSIALFLCLYVKFKSKQIIRSCARHVLGFKKMRKGLYILSAIVVMVVSVGCGGAGLRSARITMTTEQSGQVSFRLSGSGTATVDWGDGSERVSLTLNENGVEFRHTYPNATMRTILINGDNITGLSVGSGIRLTSLDVSRNTVLTSLDVSGSGLTSLDVSRNTALTSLRVSRIQFTSLDVSRNTALTNLYVSYNQLTSLDVSRNTVLTNLNLQNNQLTSLDVSRNTALTHLNVGNNQLTSLDVSRNTVLTNLNLQNNQLTSLDVSRNTALAHLNAYNNQLTNLDVSRNTALMSLRIQNNLFSENTLCTILSSLPIQNPHHPYPLVSIGGNPGAQRMFEQRFSEWSWSMFYHFIGCGGRVTQEWRVFR